MRALPTGLEPWAEQLAALPSDLALALLPWLRRFDAALGETGTGRFDEQGEPDGYDGVHARGPYHRLLSSHWLLAQEQPDEFMRRAVMGEHRFFRIARRIPQAERAIVALLDVGPDQLGAPRIGQLAALLVLARRAARAGGRLLWSQLASRDPKLHEGVGADALQAWLTGRTVTRPSPADCEHWTAKLDAEQVSADRWLVGSSRLVAYASARDFHQITLESPLFAETTTLELRLRARGSRTFGRALELPLPEQHTAVRLLRDPFRELVAAPVAGPRGQRIDLGSPPHLAADCRSVTVRLEGGDIVVYPFASSANATQAHPRYFKPPERHRVLAVTRAGRRMHAVTLRGNSVFLFGAGKQQLKSGHYFEKIAFASDVIAAVRMGDRLDEAVEEVPLIGPLGSLTVRHMQEGGIAFTVVRGGKVIELRPTDDRYGVVEHVGVLASAGGSVKDGCIFLRRLSEHELEVKAQGNAKPPKSVKAAAYEGAAFIGHNTVAVEILARTFAVAQLDREPVQLTMPRDFVVVGAMDGGLVCLTEEGRVLALVERSGITPLARSSVRIAQVSVGHLKPMVAFSDSIGGLTVVARGLSGPVLRVLASEAR